MRNLVLALLGPQTKAALLLQSQARWLQRVHRPFMEELVVKLAGGWVIQAFSWTASPALSDPVLGQMLYICIVWDKDGRNAVTE